MEGMQMTPEEQRTAIAEACGWKTGYRDPEAWHPLPDYLNDLNAMHEAEKGLVSLQWVSYSRRLQTLCDESFTWPIHATASQRAEAFLRTIGKWKEAK
jgi:hypothetical protein